MIGIRFEDQVDRVGEAGGIAPSVETMHLFGDIGKSKICREGSDELDRGFDVDSIEEFGQLFYSGCSLNRPG